MNKKKEKEILEDIRKMDRINMAASLKQLNTYENVQYFSKLGVDMHKLFKKLIVFFLKKRINIPIGGYYELTELLKEGKK